MKLDKEIEESKNKEKQEIKSENLGSIQEQITIKKLEEDKNKMQNELN